MEELSGENNYLRKICEEQENELKLFEDEHRNLKHQLDDQIIESKNFALKLNRKEDDIINYQSQIDELNKINHKLTVFLNNNHQD